MNCLACNSNQTHSVGFEHEERWFVCLDCGRVTFVTAGNPPKLTLWNYFQSPQVMEWLEKEIAPYT